MAEYNDWRPEESLTDAPRSGRDHGLDNVRFGLMFLVVFGHFLEIMPPFAGKQLLYQVIYSFHMPAFLFLAGCNARFRPRQILLRWGLPYLIFDGVYVLFARLVLKADAVFDPARPYWLLWYLPACIFYQLLLPLYDRKSRPGRWAVLAGCFVLALGAGFVDQVGYYLTASRFFVFQPWFVLGYYWKNSGRMGNPAAFQRGNSPDHPNRTAYLAGFPAPRTDRPGHRRPLSRAGGYACEGAGADLPGADGSGKSRGPCPGGHADPPAAGKRKLIIQRAYPGGAPFLLRTLTERQAVSRASSVKKGEFPIYSHTKRCEAVFFAL